MSKNKCDERLGLSKINNQGYIMTIIEYNNANNIVVRFEDKYNSQNTGRWIEFVNGKLGNPNHYKNVRLYAETINNQGCKMKVVEYSDANNIIVEFQDEYKYKIHTAWKCFESKECNNPYYPTIYEVGAIGSKYKSHDEFGNISKEYSTWKDMIRRCYDKKHISEHPTYANVSVCKEWFLFENFYEWIHSQENFEIWSRTPKSALDKDIKIKGNKIYSPDTCFLVPVNVNNLFVKNDNNRGELPIGISFHNNKYYISCRKKFIGYTTDLDEAFVLYKNQKELEIKQVASEELLKGTITNCCYDAMLQYNVDIDD